MSARTNIGRRLEIVAALLDHETRSGRGLGVVSVSEHLGREKTQISRGLAALTRAGLAERDVETLEYTVGTRLLAVAAQAGEPALLRAAWPAMDRLASRLGERVDLTVLHAGEVLTLETVAAASTVQSVGWSGRRTPVHCTASGRALTLDLDREALRALVGEDPLPAAGPHSPPTLAALLARTEQARDNGLAVADGELDADVVAVAAAIRDADGGIVAAVSVAGPAFRLRTQLDRVRGEISAAATSLSVW